MGILTQKSSKLATLSDTTGSYQTTDVSEQLHLAFFATMTIFCLIVTNYVPCWMDSSQLDDHNLQDYHVVLHTREKSRYM